MSGLLTDFRQAVQTALETDLQVPFVAGKVEGPIEVENIGCVWPLGVAEIDDQVAMEILTLGARVYLAHEPQRDAEIPYDPEPLETLVVQIQAAIKARQTAAGGPFFMRVTQIEVDVDTQGVEATIIGWAYNAGAGPA